MEGPNTGMWCGAYMSGPLDIPAGSRKKALLCILRVCADWLCASTINIPHGRLLSVLRNSGRRQHA